MWAGDVEESMPMAKLVFLDLYDRRLKRNIEPTPTSLEQILHLVPVSYQKKATPDRTEFGFIAQDVEKLFPQLVITGNEPSNTMSLNYVGLIAPIVKAMQDMKAANDNGFTNLKSDNDNLRHELEELREVVRGMKRVGARR
jgi:endosialidase-like protein